MARRDAMHDTRRRVTRIGLRVTKRAGRGWARAAPMPGERLRVLAHVPYFPPLRRAGSERSMQAIIDGLQRRGHRTTVLLEAPGFEGDLDGVTVIHPRSNRHRLRLYRAHDVVLTALSTTNQALVLGAVSGRPVVQTVHMGAPDPARLSGWPDLMVFNADWVRSSRIWPWPSVVVHPIVDPERYRTTPGDRITLLNLNHQKGGDLFFELARRLPDLSFLGVRGDWGDQLIPNEVPPNVELMGSVQDVRDVYSRTRLLLVPSRQESYGRVALEAAASGIPALVSDLPGPREALGDAGTYLPTDDVDAWASAIRALEDPAHYEEASRRGRARSEATSPDHELSLLEEALQALRVEGR